MNVFTFVIWICYVPHEHEAHVNAETGCCEISGGTKTYSTINCGMIKFYFLSANLVVVRVAINNVQYYNFMGHAVA
jgi:hypothetical protein